MRLGSVGSLCRGGLISLLEGSCPLPRQCLGHLCGATRHSSRPLQPHAAEGPPGPAALEPAQDPCPQARPQCPLAAVLRVLPCWAGPMFSREAGLGFLCAPPCSVNKRAVWFRLHVGAGPPAPVRPGARASLCCASILLGTVRHS